MNVLDIEEINKDPEAAEWKWKTLIVVFVTSCLVFLGFISQIQGHDEISSKKSANCCLIVDFKAHFDKLKMHAGVIIIGRNSALDVEVAEIILNYQEYILHPVSECCLEGFDAFTVNLSGGKALKWPKVFHGDTFLGTVDELRDLHRSGQLTRILKGPGVHILDHISFDNWCWDHVNAEYQSTKNSSPGSVVVFTSTRGYYEPNSRHVIDILSRYCKFEQIDINQNCNKEYDILTKIISGLAYLEGWPRVFVRNEYLGSSEEIDELHRTGKLLNYLKDVLYVPEQRIGMG